MSDFVTEAIAARVRRPELTADQELALRRIVAWRGFPHERPQQQVFRLFGPAGTGKTTIMERLPRRLPLHHILFAAYTGKAASRLRAKGCPRASTLHALAMRPVFADDDDGKVLVGFEPNPDSPIASADLLVIDECSMVNAALGRLILSFGKPVLVVGDPMQLPPPVGLGFFAFGLADVALRSVHRQEDDTLLQFATAARKGQRGLYGDRGAVRIIHEVDVTAEDVFSADQILVGRNATRARYNTRIRQLLGRTNPWPTCGDKLVCRRNNPRRGFWNGELWHVTRPAKCVRGRVQLTIVPDDASHPAHGTEQRVTLPITDFTAAPPESEPSHRQRDRF
jgi:exodeoxyribonuclease-5